MSTEKRQVIRSAYLHIFSGVGVILMLLGAYFGSSYYINSTQFDKYPLEQYQESECELSRIDPYMPAPEIDMKRGLPATSSADERQKQCEERLDKRRNIKRVEDLSRALTFLALGFVVFVPHWLLARKSS